LWLTSRMMTQRWSSAATSGAVPHLPLLVGLLALASGCGRDRRLLLSKIEQLLSAAAAPSSTAAAASSTTVVWQAGVDDVDAFHVLAAGPAAAAGLEVGAGACVHHRHDWHLGLRLVVGGGGHVFGVRRCRSASATFVSHRKGKLV